MRLIPGRLSRGVVSATPPPDRPSASTGRRPESTGRTKRVLLVCTLDATTVAAIATLLRYGIPLGVRIDLGVPLVFLAPGYALKRAIFPARPGGWPESAALLLYLSLVAGILVALVLNVLPWGLSATSWAIGIGSVMSAAAAVTAYRARELIFGRVCHLMTNVGSRAGSGAGTWHCRHWQPAWLRVL